MFHDPTIAGAVSFPAELIPKPPAKRSAPASATSAVSMPPPSETPTSMPTVVGALLAICAEAQVTAFPGIVSKVDVASSDKGGADYQNNSALALFGKYKSDLIGMGIKSPRDVAQKLADAMLTCDKSGMIGKAEVAGAGFININLSAAWFSDRVNMIAQHGALPPTAPKKKVVCDFSSPNVAKEMHAGHLRSTIIGDSICRVLEFCGHEVLRVNHVGDWGTQFGMLIGHLKQVFPDFASKPPPIGDLQAFYKESKKHFDEDPAFAKLAHEEVVRLQGGDGSSRYAWHQICEVSRREFEKVYSRLGVQLTEVGESFYNEYIHAVVAHLDEIGLVSDSVDEKDATRIAKVIFPPNTKHEQPLMVVKSDGGFGYDSTDMAAVWYRIFEHKADWIIYVTDAGQAPHFELVFEAARAAGWATEATRLDHVPFGLVCGDDGKKFKTRAGDTVRLVDLLDEAVHRMKATLDERKAEQLEEAKKGATGGRISLTQISDEQLKEYAAIIGYSAVKYADLKSNRISNYIFNYDRMLADQGNTAVYLLYAGARIASIVRNSGVDTAALLASGERVVLVEPTELKLGKELLRFQEVIELMLQTLQPNFICEYLFELCGHFTKFYQACKVNGDPAQNSRLLLLLALEKVMRKGFHLVGLGYLERI